MQSPNPVPLLDLSELAGICPDLEAESRGKLNEAYREIFSTNFGSGVVIPGRFSCYESIGTTWRGSREIIQRFLSPLRILKLRATRGECHAQIN